MKNPSYPAPPRIATGRAESAYFARANRGGKFNRQFESNKGIIKFR